MHCILLGVFSNLLNRQIKFFTKQQMMSIDNILSKIRAPYELTAHGRKPRKLSEISNFKANEYFNFLFYFCPVLFRNFLNTTGLQYKNLLRLSNGIRILLLTSDREKVRHAAYLLDRFCRDAIEIFGSYKCETSNLHSMRHLADQVTRFGPLYVSSAMSFESAHSFLARMASGSHDFCEIICRRYLEKQNLLSEQIEDDSLRDLTIKWTGQSLVGEEDPVTFFDQFILKTDFVTAAEILYPKCKIFSRANNGKTVFDSTCYQRNPMGFNSFVQFQRRNCNQFGHVEYFITFTDSNQNFAFVSFFSVTEKFLSNDLTLRDNWFVRVEKTKQTDFVRSQELNKVACIENESKIWLAKLPRLVDHK